MTASEALEIVSKDETKCCKPTGALGVIWLRGGELIRTSLTDFCKPERVSLALENFQPKHFLRGREWEVLLRDEFSKAKLLKENNS